jgi:DNA ligase (NAD+)
MIKNPAGALQDKTFVLTGVLAGFTRAEATARVEAAGGRVAGSVGRGTDYLVAGENPGTKLAEARKRGVPVLGEEEFIRLLGGN